MLLGHRTGVLAAAAKGNEPTVWVLTQERCGDYAQAVALAEARGWRYVVKPLSCTRLELPVLLALGASVFGVDRASRAGLQPPWPDVVIGAVRQTESVARWVSAQASPFSVSPTKSSHRRHHVDAGRGGIDQQANSSSSIPASVHARCGPENKAGPSSTAA